MSGESKGQLGDHKIEMYFGSDGENNYRCGAISYDNHEYENDQDEVGRKLVKDLLLKHSKEELAELLMQLADNGRECVWGENI